MSPQAANLAPRWLPSRTWGETSDTLELASRFRERAVQALRRSGHEIALLQPYDELVGHAAAVLLHPDGLP